MQTNQYTDAKAKVETLNEATKDYHRKVNEQIATLKKLREHVDFELVRLGSLAKALGVVGDHITTRPLEASLDTLGQQGGVEDFTPTLRESDLIDSETENPKAEKPTEPKRAKTKAA